VLATGGDTFLGGIDFDNRIIDFVLERSSRDVKLDLSTSPIAMQRVKNAAEAAKIDLSLMQNVSLELPFIEERKGKPVDLRMPLTREQLNALTRDLVDRTFEICDDGLDREGHCALVDRRDHSGRVARAACRWCSNAFSSTSARLRARACTPTSVSPWGPRCSASRWTRSDSVTLLDALSMPIGYGLPTGRFRRIIDKNHRVPMVKSFRVPPPQRPGAPFVEIDIFQGDSEFIVDNEYLGYGQAARLGHRQAHRLPGRSRSSLLHVLSSKMPETATEVKLATRDTP
jgi:molecular chaperone DnaK